MKHAFTLVEMLVVITIVLFLVSLLTPALDKALYEAELATCASNLRQISSGMTQYALDFDRHFPSRHPEAKPTYLTYETDVTNGTIDYDIRPAIEAYVGLVAKRSLLNCPLSPAALDFKNTDHGGIEADYNLFFGYQFLFGQRRLAKLGDRATYRGNEFNLMAGDMEVHSASYAFYGPPQAEAAHPDSENKMSPWVDTQTYYFSRYWNFNGNTRGVLDLNFARTDGSASQYRDLIVRDTRLTLVPFAPNPYWDYPEVVAMNVPHVGQ